MKNPDSLKLAGMINSIILKLAMKRGAGELTRIGYALQATAAANIVKAVPLKAKPASWWGDEAP